MEKIQLDDKLIASAHGPDVAVSGPAPGRPRQRLALILLGLIAISLGATADIAHGERAGSHSGCKAAADLHSGTDSIPYCAGGWACNGFRED
jgi:hypothetical protein